jgi:N-acetylmuramoyl-L-alanine amidase
MTEPQKKNGRSTPPSNRSRSSYQHRRRKPTPILHRLAAKCKRLNWRTLLAVLLALLIVFFLTRCATGSGKDPGATGDPKATTEATTTPEPEPPQPTVYIFRDGEGCPVNMEGLTNAWAAEAGFEKRYTITDEERYELASVITAEAVGEPYAGKVAVAQCILQACEDDGIRPLEALERYTYSTRRPEPTDEALAAVAAVFDFGHVATVEPIKYFYAPDLASSEWHESQVYVMTINNHKFFKEAQ